MRLLTAHLSALSFFLSGSMPTPLPRAHSLAENGRRYGLDGRGRPLRRGLISRHLPPARAGRGVGLPMPDRLGLHL